VNQDYSVTPGYASTEVEVKIFVESGSISFIHSGIILVSLCGVFRECVYLRMASKVVGGVRSCGIYAKTSLSRGSILPVMSGIPVFRRAASESSAYDCGWS